jgi:hypothetical protein
MKTRFSDDDRYIRDRGRRLPGSTRSGMLRGMREEAEDGFTCRHCGAFVSSAISLAGVINRNHCPYCLWSRHLDLERPGDRMSACKALMRPVGLARKKVLKKYGEDRGELMLVHRCTECDRLSANRLAADDDVDMLLAVYQASLQETPTQGEIITLDGRQAQAVWVELFGQFTR